MSAVYITNRPQLTFRFKDFEVAWNAAPGDSGDLHPTAGSEWWSSAGYDFPMPHTDRDVSLDLNKPVCIYLLDFCGSIIVP